MSTQQDIKRLTESDEPIRIDPVSVKKGYLVLPIGVANAIGHSNLISFISDTIATAYPELWIEVRRKQTLEYEGFCIPDHVSPDPKIGISQLQPLIDTSRYSIVVSSFDIRVSGQAQVRVIGGFCFPESPSRIVIPIKGKILPMEKAGGTITSKKWWQIWRA